MEHLLTREFLWKYALIGIVSRKRDINIHPIFERRIPSMSSELSARRALGSVGLELRFGH